MTDGYEMELMSDRGIYVPVHYAVTLEVKKYLCKKDFFDIKKGMMVYAYESIKTIDEHRENKHKAMVIDAKKWGDSQPINNKIFNEHFEEDYGLLPFYMIDTLSKKDRDKYYKERREIIYYE